MQNVVSKIPDYSQRYPKNIPKFEEKMILLLGVIVKVCYVRPAFHDVFDKWNNFFISNLLYVLMIKLAPQLVN